MTWNHEKLAQINTRIEKLRETIAHYEDHNDVIGARTARRDLDRLIDTRNGILVAIDDELEAARNYRKRTTGAGDYADDFGNSLHDWS